MKEVVNVFVTDLEHGQFVAVRRISNDKYFPGMLALPGGGIETGESIEEAAKREFHEETGIELSEVGEVIIETPLSVLGTTLNITVVGGKIVSDHFSPIDKDITETRWVRASEFLESLDKSGYPTTEVEKLRIFLMKSGFQVDQ